MLSSMSAMDTPMLTGTALLATVNSGKSRRAVVPLVKIEKGVPEPVRAAMTPGHQAVAALGTLVGIGVGAECHRLLAP